MEVSLAKKYINIYISLKEECYDMVFALMQGMPFTGIEERFDEIIITFKFADWNDELRQAVLEIVTKFDEKAEITKEEILEDKNWNEEWESKVEPIRVDDKLVITPEWKKDELDAEYKIIINPKMSFGTGDHQTTRLVCRLMQKVNAPGKYWIDAGTGTGVLAIYAVMLGAREVYAFDNNIWSIENARENFEINNVADKIVLEDLDIENCTLPDADIIVANLFLSLVVPSMPLFAKSLRKSKGDLIISGVLKYHHQDILDAAEANNLTHIESIVEDEWIAVHLKAE